MDANGNKAGKLVWTPGIFKQIRTDTEIIVRLNEIAEGLASSAGDGYEANPAKVTGGRGRGRSEVVTRTPRAMRHEAKTHDLLKAAGSGVSKPKKKKK